MKRFLIVLLCLIGGMTILVVGGAILLGLVGLAARPSVASHTILEVNLEQPTLEAIPDDPLASFLLKDVPTLLETVQALERAAADDRVAGIVARIGRGGNGMAMSQELRDAVQAFRASGKFAIAYSDSFGEVIPGNGGYYIATAFEEIWLQPSGQVGLTGLAYEHPFVKGTLDKLGIEPQIDRRYEYKNAANFYTEEGFSEAHREASQAFLDSWFSQIVRGVSEARGIPEAEVRELADRGPYLASEALRLDLVDGLAYRDQVLDAAMERAGGNARRMDLAEYLDRSREPRGPTIALVYGVGAVVRGGSGFDPLSGEIYMGSDTVSEALRDAADDPSVQAILFRIDSPGGSAVASDTIWRAVHLARESGTPVIVSMGNLAASGGYYVALEADEIVAQPGTLTGSIGVYAGKMVTREMWQKIGVTWDEVHTSKNALIWSSLQKMSPQEWERFQASLDNIYEDFTAKVADGRDMSMEEVLEAAKGRVWTGEDAVRLGLVDHLGGFATALRLAREVAGIDPDRPVRLRRFPRPKTPFQSLMEAFETRQAAAAAEALRRSLRTIQPLARQARLAALGPSAYGPLAFPPLESQP